MRWRRGSVLAGITLLTLVVHALGRWLPLCRLWEDSTVMVRQLPSVGRLLGARLAAAGLGSLHALAACGDAHRLEIAAQK